jgi:hypothetical protein
MMNDFEGSDEGEDDLRSSIYQSTLSKTSPMGVVWESNKSSSTCGVCSKPFGRFKMRSRYHHCRYCGRLVCATCSSKRVSLPNLVSEQAQISNTNTHDPNTSLEKSQPVRVCDPCYRVITAKEEKIIQRKLIQEKKSELRTSTSLLNNSLLDIYFLDGSHRTLCYDESSLASDLMHQLHPTISISLFEVEEDLYDPKQYTLILADQPIVDVIYNWKKHNLQHVKIVCPIADQNCLKNPFFNQSVTNRKDSSNIDKKEENLSKSFEPSVKEYSNILSKLTSASGGSHNLSYSNEDSAQEAEIIYLQVCFSCESPYLEVANTLLFSLSERSGSIAIRIRQIQSSYRGLEVSLRSAFKIIFINVTIFQGSYGAKW